MQRYIASGKSFRPQSAPGTVAESVGKLELNNPGFRVFFRQVEFGWQAFWDLHRLPPPPVMIDDQVAGDLVDSALGLVPFRLAKATRSVALTCLCSYVSYLFLTTKC
jgi:hypothetical protein